MRIIFEIECLIYDLEVLFKNSSFCVPIFAELLSIWKLPNMIFRLREKYALVCSGIEKLLQRNLKPFNIK